MVRFLGVDYGERRIGLAVSDPLEVFASPHSVLHRTEPSRDLDALIAVIHEERVEALVVGAPHHDDGTPSPMTRRVEAFVAELLKRKTIPVFWVDEGYSSIEAEDMLKRSIRDWRERRQRIDMVAAQLILRSFLDQRARDRRRAEQAAEDDESLDPLP